MSAPAQPLQHSPFWRAPPSSAPTGYPVIEAARIKGECPERFDLVRKAFQRSLDGGDDIGASVAVFIGGESVVDLWGGYFDASFERPWDRDTIITTHSITKTMTGLAALLLADSGELDLDAPVARYWPKFAAAGKSQIPVRQLLSHSSGLAGWTEDVSWADVFDLERSSDMLARQAPWWAPGTASAYHGITQGHLVNGVIQRITGKTLGQYYAEHIARPAGIDYHIGTGPADDHRISTFVQATPEWKPSNNPIAERVGLNPNLTPQTSHATAWRRAEVGAANGHGNARSVAAAHSLLACGEANGVRLLSDRARHWAVEPQINGVDLLLGAPITWGLTFALETPLIPNPRGHRLAYWGGNGGSFSVVDLDERLVVSYVMNRWMEGPHEVDRFLRLWAAVNACLDRR